MKRNEANLRKWKESNNNKKLIRKVQNKIKNKLKIKFKKDFYNNKTNHTIVLTYHKHIY